LREGSIEVGKRYSAGGNGIMILWMIPPGTPKRNLELIPEMKENTAMSIDPRSRYDEGVAELVATVPVKSGKMFGTHGACLVLGSAGARGFAFCG
jgi:hypothetical protein